MTEREREIYEDSIVYEEPIYVYGAEEYEDEYDGDDDESELWFCVGDVID